ncbi:MAG: carbamate kinase, partial [bacterium]|nr:carbamate kinase [bacterium]
TPEQINLGQMTLGEVKKYYAEGHFKAGSMGPKILAAIRFVENGGKRSIITSLDMASEALLGRAGTIILRP